MCPAIDKPASCEIPAVIRFLHDKNMSSVEIHCELCAVYGQNIMSEGTVRQWCRMFKDWRKNIHDEQRSVRTSVMSDHPFKSVDQKYVKDGASQFQNFRLNFHKFHALFSTRLSQLG
jgi:hypothetical protein